MKKTKENQSERCKAERAKVVAFKRRHKAMRDSESSTSSYSKFRRGHSGPQIIRQETADRWKAEGRYFGAHIVVSR